MINNTFRAGHAAGRAVGQKPSRRSTAARCLKVLSCVWCLGIPPFALAANFCATTSAEFEADLAIAAQNMEADFIKLAPGVYTPSGDAFVFSTTNPYGLTISGGFASRPGAPCSVPLFGAHWTVIDGLNSKRLFEVMLSGGGAPTFYINNLTLQNGYAPSSNAIDITDFSGETQVFITGVNMQNVIAQFGLRIDTAGAIVVRNSVFTDNQTSKAFGNVISLRSTKQTSGTAIAFNSNTISANHVFAGGNSVVSISNSGVNGVIIDAHLTNSVIWANDAPYAISFFQPAGSGKTYLDSNDIESNYNPEYVVESASLHVDPGFISDSNFHLSISSPLRDAGNKADPTGTMDADGNPRIVYSTVDVGAYEFQDVIFKNGVELP